ncbi:MAG: hypothetical protein M3328_10790, partial [Chloroflexota bacterium]|nr:hypothetical protein [Chloroflexota bacterium]
MQDKHVVSNEGTGAVPAGGVFIGFRTWYWLLVPALAVAAYATVLRVGFLADDFLLLEAARVRGVGVHLLLPQEGDLFYRPMGQLLTWVAGWHLWGFNPMPFHVQGLLLHAMTSLVLALWIGNVSSRPLLGWLSGALFAVFPAHLEAVGWVASQWDIQATLFGLLSVWQFTLWWKRRPGGRWHLLLASVLCYALGLFVKESLLTFLPIIGLAAWVAKRPAGWREWRALGLTLLPFGLVVALNVAIRYATWGSMGGYPGLRMEYSRFFWDGFLNQLHVLLSPVNPAVFNDGVAQIAGATSMSLLLLGLALYGRASARILALGSGWLVFTLIPVLNLPVSLQDLQQNRFLYLPSVGYCICASTLLYAALEAVKHRRSKMVGLGAVACILLLGIVASWVQLRPWHTASVIAEGINEQTRALVPPREDRSVGMTWYVEKLPDTYRGAYLYRLGMGLMRSFTTDGDATSIEQVSDATSAPIAATASQQDVFAMSFRYDRDITGYRVDYLRGLTHGSAAPANNEGESNNLLWDFTRCEPVTLAQWSVAGADYACQPGEGLSLRPQSGDAQLVSPDFALEMPGTNTAFVRLRVVVAYP